MAAIDLDLSGFRLRLDGLTSSLAGQIGREWGPFVAGDAGGTFLRLTLSFDEREAPTAPFDPKSMGSELAATTARFTMAEGEVEVSRGGRAHVRLARRLGRREYWTLMNLLRACLAWCLPEAGAALVHAAGLIVDSRAYFLVGPAGSGKSTWARMGERDGARVLSDDLVLVDASGARPEALGAPFRSTHVAEYTPGRWPLAAVLFPRRADAAGWSPAPALLAKARLVANLPFIADAPPGDSRVPRLVDRLSGAVPCVDFGFSPESSFMDVLRSLP